MAQVLGKTDDDAQEYARMKIRCEVCRSERWDAEWFIRGITASGKKIGAQNDEGHQAETTGRSLLCAIRG